MKSLNIAFDIDGVVANFIKGFIPWLKRAYDIEYVQTDKFNGKLTPPLAGHAIERIIAEFIREFGWDIKSHVDGESLIDYVWKKTHEPVLFVTARHHSTVQATHNWIGQYFPYIEFLIATVDSSKKKIEYLKNFECFVEDRRRTALELAEKGKTVFMPLRSYNYLKSDHPNVIKVPDLRVLTTGKYDHLIFK